jgi:hypothetical protein
MEMLMDIANQVIILEAANGSNEGRLHFGQLNVKYHFFIINSLQRLPSAFPGCFRHRHGTPIVHSSQSGHSANAPKHAQSFRNQMPSLFIDLIHRNVENRIANRS